MRCHDLTGDGETDSSELSFRGIEEEQEVECVGPRTRGVLDGDPHPTARKRDHAEIDEVVASSRRADGPAQGALDPLARGRRAGISDRIVGAVRKGHVTRSRFLTILPESHRTRSDLGRGAAMTDCDLRGAENCRTLRARWVAAGFPIPGVLVIASSSCSRHLRIRTDPETTYVKARNAHTLRLHRHVELSTREADRSCVQPRQEATARALLQKQLSMSKIAVPLADDFEDDEFSIPVGRLAEAQHEVVVMGVEPGAEVEGKRHRVRVEIDAAAARIDPDDFDMLLIPGGYSPDHLRTEPAVVSFVRRFCESGRPVAAICHGPQLLIEADAVRGRHLTSWPSVRKDLENAGATWSDQEVVVDGNLTTSRKPDDLEAFSNAVLRALK